MDEMTDNQVIEHDKWDHGRSVQNLQQEKYEGSLLQSEDCWEPQENGSDIEGSLHVLSSECDVYGGFLYNVTQSEVTPRKPYHDGSNDLDLPDEEAADKISHNDPPIICEEFSDSSDDVFDLPQKHSGGDLVGDSFDSQIDRCVGETPINPPHQHTPQVTETPDTLVEEDTLETNETRHMPLVRAQCTIDEKYSEKSKPFQYNENKNMNNLHLSQYQKHIHTLDNVRNECESLDERHKAIHEPEVRFFLDELSPLNHGQQMIIVVICHLFGLQCFVKTMAEMLCIALQTISKQYNDNRFSTQKSRIPHSLREIVMSYHDSFAASAKLGRHVYMVKGSGQIHRSLQEDGSMLSPDPAGNGDTDVVRLTEGSQSGPLEICLSDESKVATGDESHAPSYPEESTTGEFSKEVLDTVVGRFRPSDTVQKPKAVNCLHDDVGADLPVVPIGHERSLPFSPERDNYRPVSSNKIENIYIINNKRKQGDIFNLHGFTSKDEDQLIYGTHPRYVQTLLRKRRTSTCRVGLLRDPRIHNISTEGGFQRNRHYMYWKTITEDQFGRMMLCRARDQHTTVTFIMLERRSEWFREGELLFYLEFGGKVRIIPELMGVLCEDGYVKMMFPYIPGHNTLSAVFNQGDCVSRPQDMNIFIEQLIRGMERLHAHDVIIGGITGDGVLLDGEFGTSTVYIFPFGVRMTEHMKTPSIYHHFNDNFLAECRREGVEPITRVIREDKARDMLSIGHLLQTMTSNLQNPSQLLAQLMTEVLEPDIDKRITASRVRKHPYFQQIRCLSMD